MIRKMLAFLSALVLLCAICPALAERYNEPALLDRSDTLGLDTHYYLYDRDFYEAPDDQPGTVVKIKYPIDLYDNKTYTKYLNVYLPYGYDEAGTERYPVIYFFHGRGCDPSTLIGNEATKNAFDHMISTGIAKPFILVTPTYYYGRGTNYDSQLFVTELREVILPLVEGTYRTYAETADEAGFRASREYRAICGFSMGSMITFGLIDDMLDEAAYFLPFSGASSNVEALRAVLEGYEGKFFLYMASGGPEDGAYTGCASLAQSLAADDFFSYGPDPAENNVFYVASDNIHQDLSSRYYLYNAFLDGVLWPDL